MSDELTDAEIERIDLLHNATHEYLTKVLPNYTEWDTGIICEVCDAVTETIVSLGLAKEQDFYPYREEPGDDDGDPSIDCTDFYWADLAMADDHGKCCEMCGNVDEGKKECGLK